jgi:hypothetical protein
MRFIIALVCGLWLGASHAAHAGAWLREKGTTFTATSFTVNYFRDVASTTYIEHGWRDDMTVGLDVGYFTSRFGTTTGYGTLFLRRAIGPGTGPNQWAYELGAGTGWAGNLVLPHVKAGLSWGRGYQLGDKNGWMTVDASITVDVTHGEQLHKLDAAIGIGLTDTTKSILQLYLSHLQGETYGVVAPSLVYSPKERKFSIQIGAESPLHNWDDTAIKIGLWREF